MSETRLRPSTGLDTPVFPSRPWTPARRPWRGVILICLIVFQCPRCGAWVAMCRSCYRNHVYCSKECSAAARHEGKQDWQHRHRQTEAGRKDHREQERARRLQKSVGRHTSPACEDVCTMAPKPTPSGKETGFDADQAEVQTAEPAIDRAVEDYGEPFFTVAGSLEAGQVHRCAFCGRTGVIVERFERRPTGRTRSPVRLS